METPAVDRADVVKMEKVGGTDTKFSIPQGQSQTMATLKGLVQKGVKVDLGIPLELWDELKV